MWHTYFRINALESEVRKFFTILTVLLLVFVNVPLGGCAPAKPVSDRITLQVNWVHAPEFIGYYMADAKGYYRDASLDVTINEGGPGIQARDYILDGRADFAIASFGEQKKFIEDGKPSVAVMSVFQIPPLVMFALEGSGIKEPKDMVGKRVGIKNDYWRDIARETLANAGIDPAKMIEVTVDPNAQNLLYERKVDVWMGYAHDEPVIARVAGYNVTNIYPADYGVGGYEGLLLANEATLNQKPEVVARFVKASKDGLQYAMEHPDEAAAALVKWQPKDSIEYGKLAVRALIPLVDTPQAKIGWIDSKRWEQLMGASFKAGKPGFTMQFMSK
jgi:ABC-type nitrate/sulfonate/bicarbonate transport system substrate-binding protein